MTPIFALRANLTHPLILSLVAIPSGIVLLESEVTSVPGDKQLSAQPVPNSGR